MTGRLRWFVKDKKFEMQNFNTYGLENVLVVSASIIRCSLMDVLYKETEQ